MKISILFFIGLVSVINGLRPENFLKKILFCMLDPVQNMPIGA